MKQIQALPVLGSEGLEQVLQTLHLAELGLPAPVNLRMTEVQDNNGLVSRVLADIRLHDQEVLWPQVAMDHAFLVDLLQDGNGCCQQVSISCKVADFDLSCTMAQKRPSFMQARWRE